MLSTRMWADWGGGSKKQGLVSMIGRPPFAFSYIYARTLRQPAAASGCTESQGIWQVFFKNYFNEETGKLDGRVLNGDLGVLDSDVLIPSRINCVDVVTIGNQLFEGNTDITGVTIPDSVTSIENFAFSLCDNLAVVTFAGTPTLETIGNDAFGECLDLTGIVIPASVRTLGNDVFLEIGGFSSVYFPSSTPPTSIGGDIFYGTAVSRSGGVVRVGDLLSGDAEAFYDALVARPAGIPSSWPTVVGNYVDGPPPSP